MITALRLAFAALYFGLYALSASAHEVRSGYLEIIETNEAHYQVDWRVPVRAGQPLAVSPLFPNTCEADQSDVRLSSAGYLVNAYELRCATGLAGQQIGFTGLETTITDIIVRLTPLRAQAQTLRVTPDVPHARFQLSPGPMQIAGTYFIMGVEHILFGIDHLLFVLALVLLIRGVRKLIETITAFTLAHSVTLIGASLGWVALPSAPVEAVIALSIVFLASEIARKKVGHLQLSEQRPWLVASAFGLLHGFGFAGALSEIGLPQANITLALAAFNIGVEAGQLLFVAFVLLALALANTLRARQFSERVLSYAIGITASVWLFERLL